MTTAEKLAAPRYAHLSMTAGHLRGLSNKVHAVSPVRIVIETPDGPAELEVESFAVHTDRDDAGKPVAMPELVLNLRPRATRTTN